LVLAIGVPSTILITWWATRRTLTAAQKVQDKTLSDDRYAEYAKRYQEIISHLPYNIFMKGNHIRWVSNSTKAWLIGYIDLCSEEIIDRNKGIIGKDVWDDSEEGVERWSNFIKSNFKRSAPLLALFLQVQDDYIQLGDFLVEKGLLEDSGDKTDEGRRILRIPHPDDKPKPIN
jgi:hypothetical protein